MAMTTERPPIDAEGAYGQEPEAASGDSSATAGPRDRVGTLRGAGVQVDTRRLSQIGIAIILVTLAALTIGFTVGGVHKNQQIDQLHGQGVPVTITVTGCLGLLGGSGSNAAGYSCHGSYRMRGHTYDEPLPGSAFHKPGSTIAAVAVPADPALVSPVSIVNAEHSSASVYILPVLFGALFLLLAGGLIVRARRRSAASDSDVPEPSAT